MERMSRVGRKAQIVRILHQQYKRKNDRWMTCGQIARRLGLKSSTNIKNMMRELVDSHDNVCSMEEHGVYKIGYIPLRQMELPERFIVINGRQHKVASWTLVAGDDSRYA